MAAGKLTADGALAVRPTALAIDGSYVYLGLEGSNALVAHSAKDQTEVRRVDVGGLVEHVTPANEKYVTVTVRNRTTILSFPDLRPAVLAGHTPRPMDPVVPVLQPRSSIWCWARNAAVPAKYRVRLHFRAHGRKASRWRSEWQRVHRIRHGSG